jgi:glycosyltransferase involved in cell wall biosynthesis
MRNGISLCMIVKNEQHNLSHLLESVLPVVEEAHLVDTGSTDRTVSIIENFARRYPGRVQLHHWRPPARSRFFPFALARNHSFTFATQEWILYLDGDDRIDRRKLQRFKDRALGTPNVDAWIVRYVYATNHDGSPHAVADRERFLRRSLHPRWAGGVHAMIQFDRQPRARFWADLDVVQDRTGKPDPTARNAAMLQAEQRRNPKDLRVLGNLATTLYDLGDLRSIRLMKRFLRQRRRPWTIEIDVRYSLGEYLVADARPKEAEQMADRIHRLAPHAAESFYLRGAAQQQRGELGSAIAWYRRCLPSRSARRLRACEYYSTSDLRTWKPLRRMAECYAALGSWARAEACARKAQRYLPDDAEGRRWSARILTGKRAAQRAGSRATQT